VLYLRNSVILNSLLILKTTLVNYILKEQTKWKICVIENEFGEVSIDTDLVEENLASREDIITMGESFFLSIILRNVLYIETICNVYNCNL